jgi:hypothetical protein
VRIGSDVLLQRVDDNHIVIVDTSTGEQVVLSKEMASRLLQGLQYFFPDLFIDITPPMTEVPT